MSDTPRTDAEAANWHWEPEDASLKFAETLERELAATKTQLEAVTKERDEALASLPLITGKTRSDARQMLGPVLRHIDDEDLQASHGCVEVQHATQALKALIAERDAALERSRRLSKRASTLAIELAGLDPHNPALYT